jgi:hypothetical protein
VIAVLVLAPLLAGWAPIAPEHVHERDAHHGHTLVHRHLEPHHSADSHDADHAEVEAMLHHEHAGRLVWLTAASLHQVAYQLDLPPAILSAAMSARPPAISWIATQFNDAAPPHGPPRPSSPLRGPPSYPA